MILILRAVILSHWQHQSRTAENRKHIRARGQLGDTHNILTHASVYIMPYAKIIAYRPYSAQGPALLYQFLQAKPNLGGMYYGPPCCPAFHSHNIKWFPIHTEARKQSFFYSPKRTHSPPQTGTVMKGTARRTKTKQKWPKSTATSSPAQQILTPGLEEKKLER